MPTQDILISSFTNIAIKRWIDNKNNNPLWNKNPSKNREYITSHLKHTHTHTHQKLNIFRNPRVKLRDAWIWFLNPQDCAKNIGAN